MFLASLFVISTDVYRLYRSVSRLVLVVECVEYFQIKILYQHRKYLRARAGMDLQSERYQRG